MKEISYIHSEAYAVGELKHGTISLIEDGTLSLRAHSARSLRKDRQQHGRVQEPRRVSDGPYHLWKL